MSNFVKISWFFLFQIIFFSACSQSQSTMRSGDNVLTDWYKDNWHMSKLVATCSDDKVREGWSVNFNDDFYDPQKNQKQPCYALAQIIPDRPPNAPDVKVGDSVLAEWVNDAYNKAKVTKIDGQKYSVNFVVDNLNSELGLEKIRLLPKK